MSIILLHMVWPRCKFRMHAWNVLHVARWKYRMQKNRQKLAIWAPLHKFVWLCLLILSLVVNEFRKWGFGDVMGDSTMATFLKHSDPMFHCIINTTVRQQSYSSWCLCLSKLCAQTMTFCRFSRLHTILWHLSIMVQTVKCSVVFSR